MTENNTYIVRGKRISPFKDIVNAPNAGSAGDIIKKEMQKEGDEFIPVDIHLATPDESMK